MSAPTPTVTLLGPDGGPLFWSHSAAAKANRCPRWWAYRNGPLRVDLGEKDVGDAQRRGLVVHDAIAAGLRAAVEDARPLPGTMLDRYWPVVRRELGAAWERHEMPTDRGAHAVAEQVTAMARYVCEVTRCPRPGDVIAIEDTRETTTPAGRPFRYIIDYGRWVNGRVRITDWKTGSDDPDAVRRSAQLARYAWFLARDLGIPLEQVDVELHNVSKQRTRVAAVDTVFANRSVRHIDTLAAAMERHAEQGEFPGVPGSQCATCDARAVCPVLAGHVPPGDLADLAETA